MPRSGEGPRFQGPGRVAVLAAAVSLVAACTYMPETINPVRWYESAMEVLKGEKVSKTDALARKIPGADDPFPKLGQTPEPPARKTLLAEFEADREALMAELAAARRAGGPLPAAPPATAPDDAEPAPAVPEGESVPMVRPAGAPPPQVAVLRFEPDSDRISAEGHATLVKVAMLHRMRGGALEIVGVGDTGGALIADVADKLAGLGVARDALVMTALPEDGPTPALPDGAADVFLVF